MPATGLFAAKYGKFNIGMTNTNININIYGLVIHQHVIELFQMMIGKTMSVMEKEAREAS